MLVPPADLLIFRVNLRQMPKKLPTLWATEIRARTHAALQWRAVFNPSWILFLEAEIWLTGANRVDERAPRDTIFAWVEFNLDPDVLKGP